MVILCDITEIQRKRAESSVCSVTESCSCTKHYVDEQNPSNKSTVVSQSFYILANINYSGLCCEGTVHITGDSDVDAQWKITVESSVDKSSLRNAN